MADPRADTLAELSRVPGVRGALVVDPQAGVPILTEVSEGVDGTAVAALASSLYNRSAKGTQTAEFGPLDTLQLDGEDGHVLVAEAGDLMVVAVADPDAQLGLVRLHARRVAEALR